MAGKADSFRRSKKERQTENGSTAHAEAPQQFHAFQRSREMRKKPTPSEGVQKSSTMKVGLGEVLATWGGGYFCG